MSLRFFIGEPGSGIDNALYNDIIAKACREPLKNFFVIVPEQFTMQTQQILVNLHPGHSITNIDVLSFQRLAYRIFNETGFTRNKMLDETGKSLILKKIALDEDDNLRYFSKKLSSPGSTRELKSIISELMQYNVPEKTLRELSQSSENVLCSKISDLELILSSYHKYLKDKYMTVEEVPLLLAENIKKSDLLKGSVIALANFTGFTPVQLPVIREFLKYASEVIVSLTLPASENPVSDFSETDLFAMTRKMAHDICALCEETGTPLLRSYTAAENSPARALSFLQSNIFRYNKRTFTAPQDEIRITRHKNPSDELYFAASVINNLVRTSGYRYRNFAVITGDPDTYAPLAQRIFTECGIPHFIDRKNPVIHNPFVKMIRSMLDIIRNSWDRKSIFNLLRTGLTPFSDDEIDILENAVIAGGIRGKTNWHKDWVFTESTSPESINVLRVRLTELIDPVSSVFSSKMSTVREKTTALYELGMTCRVQIKLAEKEEQLIREGKRAAAGEYSQIYKLVMDVYDKLVEIMGDDGISSSDYCDILEAALTEKRIGITPPGIDRVFVGDIVRSRTDNIRIMFFAGVNEGHIGITSNPSGLLTEADRAELLQKGIVLSPTPRQNMYRQRYYLYLALSKPSDRLYLSYSVSGTSGEALKEASLIGSICKLFPSLKIDVPDPMDFCAIEKPADGMRIIPRAIGDGSRTSDRKKYPELFNWYRRNPEYSRFVRMISEMPEKDMGSDSIGKACASALYGKDITGSATGLEQYAKCAFSYFLKYGLELSPRKTHEYKPTDRGMILHKALENYSRSLNSKRIKWQDLPSDKQDSLAESCVDEAILSLSNDLLTSDARSKYEISRLKRLMKRTVWAVTKHLEAGDFTPAGFEINFRGNDLASLNKELENGSVIHLRGIIDRIDIYEDESKILTSIIDYKTGSMEFDLVPFYHGIRIQLPLYMNAALEMIEKRFGKKAVPAGMLYYNIDDPMIDYREGIDSTYIESKILSSLRYSGLFSSEKEIREHVSKASGEKGLANVIVQKNSKNAIAGTPEMFDCISGYTDHVIRKIGEGITEGRTGIKPYKYKDTTGCQYCPYKEVCGFDNTLPGFGCDVFSENTKTVQEKLRKFKNITGELQDEMD